MDLPGRYSNLRELQKELKELADELEKRPLVRRKRRVVAHIHKLELRLGMETTQEIVAGYRDGSRQPS